MPGFIHVMENLEKYFCHGMSWNFIFLEKLWKCHGILQKCHGKSMFLVYFLNIYMRKIFTPSAQLNFIKSIEYINKCFHLLGHCW